MDLGIVLLPRLVAPSFAVAGLAPHGFPTWEAQSHQPNRVTNVAMNAWSDCPAEWSFKEKCPGGISGPGEDSGKVLAGFCIV